MSENEKAPEIEFEFYELRRVTVPKPKPDEFVIRTAALLCCDLCGGIISGMGGPADGSICIACGDLLKRGGARGAVIWQEDDKQ